MTFNLGGQQVTDRVCDLVRSEAGLAILMDRKVNTGKLDPLPYVLGQIGNETGCHTVSDLAAHERDVILACRYRRDYTQDPDLSQPGEVVARNSTELTSRHAGRGFKRKKR